MPLLLSVLARESWEVFGFFLNRVKAKGKSNKMAYDYDTDEDEEFYRRRDQNDAWMRCIDYATVVIAVGVCLAVLWLVCT